MRIGTKTLLFGSHQFLIHPLFLAAAWTKLYGFPWDPRLWVAFFVHDLGYWGKPNLDGAEGDTHPELGARIMHRLFDRGTEIDPEKIPTTQSQALENQFLHGRCYPRRKSRRWHDFCLYHSRWYAKRDGAEISKLCIADKYACVIIPWWIYLPLARLSGEIHEYMASPKYKELDHSSPKAWWRSAQRRLNDWVMNAVKI